MTTDELLSKLPSHIGNHKENGFYVLGKTPNEALQKLYDWCVKHNFIKG